jgi:hypothetical protein
MILMVRRFPDGVHRNCATTPEAAATFRSVPGHPRWYSVRLAAMLKDMAVRDCKGKPAARAALMAEAYLAARGADEDEPERYYLMVISLEWRGKALAELGRTAEEELVGAELVAVARKAIGTRPRTGEWHGFAMAAFRRALGGCQVEAR